MNLWARSTQQLALALCVFASVACSTMEKSIVQTPTTAQAQPIPVMVSNNGSIFQAASYKPLFEDRQPVRVGDLVNVTIEENNTAAISETSAGQRDNSIAGSIDPSIKIPFFSNFLENKLGSANISGSGSASSAGSGSNTSSNSFDASITVTVINVLPNGNLQVSGEKQMKVNEEHQVIRLSGVINPRDIRAGNTISSTRIADARVEQINNGPSRIFNQTAWLMKFFLTVLPF